MSQLLNTTRNEVALGVSTALVVVLMLVLSVFHKLDSRTNVPLRTATTPPISTTKIPQAAVSTRQRLFPSTLTLTEKRQALLMLAKDVSASPLTTAQKQAIGLEFGGSKAVQYHFTPAEKAVILKALNGR